MWSHLANHEPLGSVFPWLQPSGHGVCVKAWYNGGVWAYYFFSHCLFYDRKRIEGLMCALLATFLNHAAVHIFISWNFLASLHWGRESSVRGSFLSGKTYREACELYKALVNEMKHKRGTIILELFIIYSFGNRHCYMQPASLGSVTPDFPAPSFIVFGSFFILLHLLTRLLLSIINSLTLNICLNAKSRFFFFFVCFFF